MLCPWPSLGVGARTGAVSAQAGAAEAAQAIMAAGASARARTATSWRLRAAGSPWQPNPSEPSPSEPGPSDPGPNQPGSSQPGPSQPSAEQLRLREQSLVILRQPTLPLAVLNPSGLPTLLEVLDGTLDAPEATPKLLSVMAATLADVGWVVLRLGARRDLIAAAVAEAERAYPEMSPGKVVDGRTGAVRAGVDPTGVERGDRFALVHDERALPGGAARWPALLELDATMEEVALALGQAVERERRLPFTISSRADGMIATFPGGGAEYGCHLDSNVHGGYKSGLDPRKLTTILYLNEGWDAERDGGCLCMHDPEHSCWRTVTPVADTLVIFRADKVLHRVAASHAQRHALTVFLLGAYRDGSEPRRSC